MESHQLRRILFNTTKALRRWNKEHFCISHEKIKSLEEKLESIQNGRTDPKDQNQLKEELCIHKARLESILRQKSREIWLKKRDKNTKYFHTSLTIRRGRNKIVSIKEGNGWIQEQKGINDYFIRHFKNLYKSNSPTIPEEFNDLGQKVVTDQENANLIRIPTEEEIKDSIRKLHPLKSPGPDGYPEIFYRNYWNIIRGRVIRFVQECFRLKHVPHNFNKMFIVVIPKSKNPTSFDHFRPISLCNYVYKVVLKIIVERMKGAMGRIVSQNQGAFLEGRWIAENTVLAHEVMHKINNHRSLNGLMCIKIDLKKVYDRLEWKFIDRALGGWGFSLEVRKLITSCISTVQFSFLINGGISETFVPGQRLRQRDPLSPYLFILCTEYLTRIFNREEAQNNLHGIKISRGALALSHLMYADDLLLMSKANKREAQTINKCLDLFCEWSGQELNKDKSSILFSSKTRRDDRKAIREVLGFQDMQK